MTPFTLLHVAISLVAILSGLVVLFGLLAGKQLNGWTVVFLTTTVATSVTGFFYFPFRGFTPAQGVGILSMVLLSLAIYSRSVRGLSGIWRGVYVITSVAALYLNVFVLIIQAFQKIPVLKALAPTQSEPPFAVVQGFFLLLFIVLGSVATIRFHPIPVYESV